MNNNKLTAITLVSSMLISVPAFAEEHVHNEYQYVEAAGNKIAYLCKGEGKLTALLIAGMGLDVRETYNNTFHRAEPKGYRLCMYDRAGSGQSKMEKRRVRTMAELVTELEEFTKAAKMDELVLVPHSFGGMIARAYAHKNPEKVKGLVLIDTAHESWVENMQRKMSPDGWKTMSWIIDWEKSSNSFEDIIEASNHTKLYQVHKSLPVTVLSRGMPQNDIRQTGMSYEDVDIFNATWNEAQTKLHTISDDVEVVTMKYASHVFDKTDPWIAIEHIDKMVKRVK
ncbi:alpha/beta fold hydrolase [Pseudoalteromonas sp. T1lg65]|uniref:alpha/beta fold hydrolase n=1 Tax=Pseudoalteromonas sp. T1lg65 TaxID=2077101 RepID=UPI003F794653